MSDTFINLVNSHDVDAFLKKFCGDDVYLELLLTAALANIIKKTPEYMETLRALPENAPLWLREKWNTQPQWHQFSPRKEARLAGLVYTTALWLQKAIDNDLEWLNNTDEKGRPKKLLKLSSFQQVFKQIDIDEKMILSARRAQAREALKNEESGNETAVVMEFDDGYRLVRLLTERALDRESAFLEHCIGDGKYDDVLKKEKLFYYYSLRTPENLPCVTLSVNPIYLVVDYIAGKRNALPREKYMRYIATFCYEHRLDLTPSMKFRDGYKNVSDQEFDAFMEDAKLSAPEEDLPRLSFNNINEDVVICDGQRANSLYISDIGKLRAFPRDVVIKGDVFFFGMNFPKERPQGWVVTGTVRTGPHHFKTWEEFMARHYPE